MPLSAAREMHDAQHELLPCTIFPFSGQKLHALRLERLWCARWSEPELRVSERLGLYQLGNISPAPRQPDAFQI